MNNTFDNSLELNLELNFTNEFKTDDIMNLLKHGDDRQKHFAILNLNEIKSQQQAQTLIKNLTGQDGKIREAASFKINEFMQDESFLAFFADERLFPTLLEGIMDINGNVCRNIVSSKWSNEFKQYLCENLPKRIRKILANISELEKDEKQYKISKRNFQLYWSLEALFKCLDGIEINTISDIINICADFQDYTIREKTAKILTLVDVTEFKDVKKKLANDENYYVHRYIN